MTERYCDAPECTELAKRGNKCWTHYAWSREGKSLTTEKNRRKNGMDPLQRLIEACHTYADFSTEETDDDGETRALDNLCAAAENYTRKLWRGRAVEAQRKARARGRKPGRPVSSNGPSRWTRWRRRKFRETLDRASRG